MAEHIWFFYQPETEEKLIVLGTESGRCLSKILGVEANRWQVRKNKDGEVMLLSDCEELYASSSIVKMSKEVKPKSESVMPEDLGDLLLDVKAKTVSAAHRDTSARPSPRIPAKLPAALSAKENSRATNLAPPVPIPKERKNTTSFAEAKERSRSNSLVAKSSGKMGQREHRKHPRVDSKFRVIVVAGKRCFRSFTKNVSQGGLLLEHNIPTDLIGVECRVVIGSMDMKENIEFQAKIIAHGDHPRSLAFTDEGSSFVDRLMQWTELARDVTSTKKIA
jgi:hypothetical protein